VLTITCWTGVRTTYISRYRDPRFELPTTCTYSISALFVLPAASQREMTTSLAPLDLNIPASATTVQVQVIDTTCHIYGLLTEFFTPSIKGHTHLSCPSFAFLISHPQLGRKLLFDLGVRKDYGNLPPRIAQFLRGGDGFEVKVEKVCFWSLFLGEVWYRRLNLML
jgi:hypothetical protein